MSQNEYDEVKVVALFQVAWRYKYFVASVAGACTLIAIILALTATHIYRAEAVLTDASNGGTSDADSLASRVSGLASLAGLNLAAGGTSRESQAVLHSRHLAEEFVRRNGIAAELLRNAPKQSLWFAVDRFRESVLSIQDEKEKGITTVAIEWRDPVEVARWANAYVALANELLRARALDESSRNIKYLNEQISKTDSVEVQRVIYNLIENEAKRRMLASTREEYAFTVVDPAVTPESRVWPRRTLMVLTGGALGVLIGVLLALTHNMWKQYRGAGVSQ